MDSEKVKQHILKTSQELFRRYGYPKTSVNEIAHKSRVAKATIYKHFASKEEILYTLIIQYLEVSIKEITENTNEDIPKEELLETLVFKTGKLSFSICNEFLGWDFIRESANTQEFLKKLSDDLENLLISEFSAVKKLQSDYNYLNQIRFLIKSSKAIIFSFAFVSANSSDVIKNFVEFRRFILPYLMKAVK